MSSLEHGANAEADLTPMLDMVFQLVTFFMLVINFKAASLDLDLKLPVVGSARPVDSGGGTDLLILNVNKEGHLSIYGSVVRGVKDYIIQEAQASMMKERQRNPKLEPGDELPTTVVVRADKETTFGALNKVIVACQENGYRNFALRAMAPVGAKVQDP